MIIIHATLVFESLEAIDAFCDDRASGIEATRAEPGCVYYSFARDILDPLVLRVAETWLDEDSLAAHRAAPHMQESAVALEKWPPASVQVNEYEVVKERSRQGQ